MVNCKFSTRQALRQKPKGKVRSGCIMALTFSLSVVTGIGFHLAGRGSNHEAWHNWAVSHIVSTLLWLIVVVLHTKRYRKMFMSLAKRRAYKKFFPTLVASTLFIITTSTGIVLLLFIDGANSSIGLWHWECGIALAVLTLVHAFSIKK